MGIPGKGPKALKMDKIEILGLCSIFMSSNDTFHLIRVQNDALEENRTQNSKNSDLCAIFMGFMALADHKMSCS